jgi:hypothetical protein
MKTLRLIMIGLAATSATSHSQGAVTQNFELGEDTTAWGAAWSGGATTPTFLDASLGGTTAGAGTSTTQSFSRNFRNNTGGVDVTDPYNISMYVNIASFDGPDGGLFEIIDGSFGSNNAANLRIITISPTEFQWQARDQNTGWQSLGITMDLSQPYLVDLFVNPDTLTYSATVSSVTGTGNVLATGSLSNLAFEANVINNNANGNLLFYIEANAGGTVAMVDNINIQNIPEPASALLAACMTIPWFAGRRRPASI